MKQEIVGIDLFCGCGGLTYGLRKTGIKIVKGIDIDITAKETYVKNNPGSKFLLKDVRNITAGEIMKGVGRKGKKLLLTGCAPCQPFSLHNPYSKYDKRKSLMQCFATLIEKILPEFVLVENVPGFKTHSNPYYPNFIRTLKKNGYHFDEKIINAADYGIPQRRSRYVIIASKLGVIKIPEGTHGKGKQKYKTVGDAIKNFPAIKHGKKSSKIPNHSSCRLSEQNLERLRFTPKNGGSREDWPSRLKLNCHEKHTGHSDVYGRMSWSNVAPTLTCRCTSISNGRFGHPDQNRAISLREAATLQTFPQKYIFYGYDTNSALHVGNAVPVLLAKKLGKTFTKFL